MDLALPFAVACMVIFGVLTSIVGVYDGSG